MPEDIKTLKGKEAIRLWQEGKEVWNEWANGRGKGWDVDFTSLQLSGNARDEAGVSYIDFQGFLFSGNARFEGANFQNASSFEGATFASDASFNRAGFHGIVDFSGATFEAGASFNNAAFNGGARFDSANFKLYARFDYAHYQNEAWFNDTTFCGNALFSRTTFKKGVLFADATFNAAFEFIGAAIGGDALFDQSIFVGTAWFDDATFAGNAWFINVTFSGEAHFTAAIFEKVSVFRKTSFCGPTSFRYARFNAAFDSSGAVFRDVPELRQTSFGAHVTLRSSIIELEGAFKDEDADRFRRLKDLAILARDHALEQEFFALEMLAVRHDEVPHNLRWTPLFAVRPALRRHFAWREGASLRFQIKAEVIRRKALHWLRLAPNYFYGFFSDFGRSIWRPAICLFAIWILPTFAYRAGASQSGASLHDAAVYSASLLFPYFGFVRHDAAPAREALFGSGPPLGWVSALGFFEGLLGLIFVFLIGLALRNRFRL